MAHLPKIQSSRLRGLCSFLCAFTGSTVVFALLEFFLKGYALRLLVGPSDDSAIGDGMLFVMISYLIPGLLLLPSLLACGVVTHWLYQRMSPPVFCSPNEP